MPETERVDDIGNHLAALDCLVQVSPREGNSLTLMEAMYVGVPIVTTRVGAVAEFERAAGERLFWSVPEDPTVGEIAVQIREAIGDHCPDDRVRIARLAGQTELSAVGMAERWYELLTWACKRTVAMEAGVQETLPTRTADRRRPKALRRLRRACSSLYEFVPRRTEDP